MPELIKDILPEGSFLVSSNFGRIPKKFTRQYLQRLAATTNQMIENGLKIPAPFNHHKEAVPIDATQKQSDAFNNAGYWTSFFVGNDPITGKPVLKGVLDAPGSDDKPDTPYYKAKHTAKEVSISAIIDKPYVDGLKREWKDGLLHVALVNHAVVPAQGEFEVPEDSTIVNLSMMDDSESDLNSLMNNIRSVLKEAVMISLPDTTDVKVFLRDLLVAATQIKDNKPANGQSIEPVPIYMSIGDNDMAFSKEQAEAIVKSGTINPSTNKPFTMEELGFKPVNTTTIDMSAINAQLADKDRKLSSAIKMLKALATSFAKDKQERITQRVNALVSSGRITKEYADQHLVPKLTYQMSIDSTNGCIADHPLEVTLSALEAVSVAAKPTEADPFATLLNNSTIEPNPLVAGVNELQGKELEAAYSDLEAYLN